MEDIKQELIELEKKYQKKRDKLMKKCQHQWVETGYTSDKYSGYIHYKCSICGSWKGESF